MVDFVRVWNWYSRESVRKAILEVVKNREVVCVFPDGSYGKRPDTLQYQGDILQAVAEGCVAFHCSAERWENPMQLDVGMNKQELDKLRIGWDLIIDPDVKDFEIAKLVTKQVVEALKDHGVRNCFVKFSGGKGFHVGVAFESFPEKVNLKPTSKLYPEVNQKIVEYLKWYLNDLMKEELLKLDTPLNLSQRVGKPLAEITGTDGIEPFKVISMDVFSSRHLFRAPYSLHEKTLLVSLPIKPEQIDSFEKEQAKLERVRVEEKFLVTKLERDAEGLVIQALDWYSRRVKKERVAPKASRPSKKRFVGVEYFPPCIKKILNGLPDGRKRSVFILVTFLRNMGWELERIEKAMNEWNLKNKPPLRANYLRTQLRWHFRQDRNLLPPNCDNENFYKVMGVADCEQCLKLDIKNPVSYPLKILGLKRRRKRK